MHMAVGTKWCCGVVEIFPHGEFTPIRGHGNMARKMGLRYERLDVASAQSLANGVTVPVVELIKQLRKVVLDIQRQPTCVHPDAYFDPYLESIL